MELWDAYTRNGVKTGGVLVRGQRMWPGIYHLVCEVLVRHVDGSYLCMIRSREKPNYPLYPEWIILLELISSSIRCADQPAIREIAKRGVKSSSGIPSIR